MAKKLVGTLKLQIPAGGANPSPPVGPALGQRGINIMEFCKAFNAKTADMEQGAPCPPASFFLKKAVNIKSGSQTAGKETIAQISSIKIKEIAEAKMKDLSANDVEAAMQIVLGSARSMGIEVK